MTSYIVHIFFHISIIKIIVKISEDAYAKRHASHGLETNLKLKNIYGLVIVWKDPKG